MHLNVQPVTPVLLGSDIGAYSVARAFYEAYGARSLVFGKYPASPCNNSRIIRYRTLPNLESPQGYAQALEEAAQTTPGKLVVMGFSDTYVQLIAGHPELLPCQAVTPYASAELVGRLTNKPRFYQMLDTLGIAHPATHVIGADVAPEQVAVPFEFPVVLKASSSAEYFAHPFEGQRKVYDLHDRDELVNAVRAIRASGYAGELVLQERIPGPDSQMRVLTCYVNRDGRLAASCLGHVLLEEHTPLGRGNHALIVTERDPELEAAAHAVLEHTGLTGFANFDVKVDPRDGSYRFLELNARQGRSNYYLTHAGINVARLLVDDLVEDVASPIAPQYGTAGSTWSVVPRSVAARCVDDASLRSYVLDQAKAGRVANPLWFASDLAPRRLARLVRHALRQRKNFFAWHRGEL